MHFTNDGHLIMGARSRAGKGRDILVRSLTTNRDSALIVESKGELAAITARARREMGHAVYYLNPFGMFSGQPWNLGSHGFNPLMALDPDSPNFTAQLESLGGALIQHDTAESAHWADSARSLVVGLMMHEVLAARAEGRAPSLARVRAYITMRDEDFEGCMGAILAVTTSVVVRDRLAMYAGTLSNEMRSVRSTAKAQSTFLSDPMIARALERHDFDFGDMENTTVFAMLPSQLTGRSMTYNRYLRLILSAALDAKAARPKGRGRPVWFLIDEFYSLGQMPVVERMMSEGAGMGIQLQIIVQNLGQLKELYRNNWETFVANAGVQQWFAPGDQTTADYISKMLGQYTANTLSINAKGEASTGETGRPLLRPEEIRALGEHEQIVFLRGCPYPLLLYRAPYYEQRWGLQGSCDPNPYHLE